jgi:hypothetical protein
MPLPKIFIPHLCHCSPVPLDFLWVPAHLAGMTRASCKHASVADRQLSEVERRIADQQAYVRRMIVRGAPTQSAEDRLRGLEQKLVHLRAAHRQSIGRS